MQPITTTNTQRSKNNIITITFFFCEVEHFEAYICVILQFMRPGWSQWWKKIWYLKILPIYLKNLWRYIWFWGIAKCHLESNMVNHERLSSWVKSVFAKIWSIPEYLFSCMTSKLVTKGEFSKCLLEGHHHCYQYGLPEWLLWRERLICI